jgi:hypothetical protein
MAREVSAMLVVNRLKQALNAAADDKNRDANQLDDWAGESERGGWSTHQVDPMRAKADQLRREATELRRLLQRGE